MRFFSLPLTAVLVSMLLFGCATTQPAPATPLAAVPAGTSIVGFGTLASWGSFEMAMAPAYTRNALVRHRATRALQNHAITSAQAERLLGLTDKVRAWLDKAREATADGQETPEARVYLDKAVAELDAIEGRLP